MALHETIHDTDIDLFRQELVNLIDLRHELCVLASKIDWKSLERQFGGLYAVGDDQHHQETSVQACRLRQ